MSSILVSVDLSSIDSIIKSLIKKNIDAFDKGAFQDFVDNGFNFQEVQKDDSKIEKQFVFTDIICALETGFFDLYNLNLGPRNFLDNSIRDIYVFYFQNGEETCSSEICRDLIKYNANAFAQGAFAKFNFSDDDCIFLCLDQGLDKRYVKIYRLLAYVLYVFLIGFLFHCSKHLLEIAKNNEEYNEYLEKIEKLIERDKINNPEKQENIGAKSSIEQRIQQIQANNLDMSVNQMYIRLDSDMVKD